MVFRSCWEVVETALSQDLNAVKYSLGSAREAFTSSRDTGSVMEDLANGLQMSLTT